MNFPIQDDKPIAKTPTLCNSCGSMVWNKPFTPIKPVQHPKPHLRTFVKPVHHATKLPYGYSIETDYSYLRITIYDTNCIEYKSYRVHHPTNTLPNIEERKHETH